MYRMVADGSIIRLTHNDRFDGCPVWFPNGSCIEFDSSRPDESRIAFVSNFNVFFIDFINKQDAVIF